VVQYGLDYSAGELSSWAATPYKIDFLIRYIGYPDKPKCITHYPGAYERFTSGGLVVLLVCEGTTHDAAGGFAAGQAMANRALSDARSIRYPEHLPIFFAADGWLANLGIPLQTAMAYFRGAASVLGNQRTGVYGFRDTLIAAQQRGIGGFRWLAGSAPTDAEIRSGLCHFYQYNNGFITVGGIQCDLNWSYIDVHSLVAPTPQEDPFMAALTDGEQRELLGLARNLHYQLVTGDGPPDDWGWKTWNGGTNERLTVVDFLRRTNVQAAEIIRRLDAILAAVRSAGVDPDLVRAALTAALGGGMHITGQAVPMAGTVSLPEEVVERGVDAPSSRPNPHGGPADFDG
jgi:Rv2525c-like, glycoside hydrolase-like domain